MAHAVRRHRLHAIRSPDGDPQPIGTAPPLPSLTQRSSLCACVAATPPIPCQQPAHRTPTPGGRQFLWYSLTPHDERVLWVGSCLIALGVSSSLPCVITLPRECNIQITPGETPPQRAQHRLCKCPAARGGCARLSRPVVGVVLGSVGRFGCALFLSGARAPISLLFSFLTFP